MSEPSSRRDFLTVTASAVAIAGCGNMDHGSTPGGDPNADPESFAASTRVPQNPMPGADPELCSSTAGMVVGPPAQDLGLNQAIQFTNPMDTSQYLFVARDSQGMNALLAVCTHMGCQLPPLKPDSETWICNCHQSEYSVRGVREFGPAPRSLTRYPVCKGSDGLLRIDLTKPY